MTNTIDRSGEHHDVLVIGAGAAGAAFAWRLAISGVDVVCLDRGHWPDPRAYATSFPDWETRRVRDWNPNPNVRNLPEDYPIADDTTPIKPVLFNGVGGSTVLWSAHTPRFHPSDFRVRTLDGVGVDWPLCAVSPAIPPTRHVLPARRHPCPSDLRAHVSRRRSTHLVGIGGRATVPSCRRSTTDDSVATTAVRASSDAHVEQRHRLTSRIGRRRSPREPEWSPEPP